LICAAQFVLVRYGADGYYLLEQAYGPGAPGAGYDKAAFALPHARCIRNDGGCL
jgi:hypothetical protein